jgi:hypothetical protein
MSFSLGVEVAPASIRRQTDWQPPANRSTARELRHGQPTDGRRMLLHPENVPEGQLHRRRKEEMISNVLTRAN